jgi:hypothetical protein
VLSDVGQRRGHEWHVDCLDGVPVLDCFAGGGCGVWDSGFVSLFVLLYSTLALSVGETGGTNRSSGR